MTESARIKAIVLVLAAMGILTLCILRVHKRHQVIRTGYALSESRETLRKLREESNRLRLEESILTSPARIEELARALGMMHPTPEQLRIVRDEPSVAVRD